jgi:hypothetical protein
MTTELANVFDNGEAGDAHQRIDRDDNGNLYLTNNAETQNQLTGFEWAGWSERSITEAIRDCVKEYGEEIGLNVASQCGGYDQMGTEQQAVVDAWNEKYGR